MAKPLGNYLTLFAAILLVAVSATRLWASEATSADGRSQGWAVTGIRPACDYEPYGCAIRRAYFTIPVTDSVVIGRAGITALAIGAITKMSGTALGRATQVLQTFVQHRDGGVC